MRSPFSLMCDLLTSQSLEHWQHTCIWGHEQQISTEAQDIMLLQRFKVCEPNKVQNDVVESDFGCLKLTLPHLQSQATALQPQATALQLYSLTILCSQ